MTEDEFKELRRRFYKLGKRRHSILVSLGLCGEDDWPDQDRERSLLFLCQEVGREKELTRLIDLEEALIKTEKEEVASA